MIITIDGPSGTGKSTVAKALASKVGYTYFDTGAMYRAFAYYLLKNSIDFSNTANIDKALKEFSYSIESDIGTKRYVVGNEDVTESIRSREVTGLVSQVAAIPQVREVLVSIQKEYGKRVNAVFEGRDLGTVVFPNADLKVFLTADPEIRAQRRYDELKAKNPRKYASLSFDEIKADIVVRDEKDSTRAVSPLRRADDAHLIDTSNLSIEQVVEQILVYKEKQID